MKKIIYTSSLVILGLILGILIPSGSAVAVASSVYKWSTPSSLQKQVWTTPAMSSDGSTMLVGGFSSASDSQSYLYLSTNHGSTWSPITSLDTAQWSGAAVSSDGSTMVAVQYSAGDWGPGNMYVSRDHGSTWSIVNTLTSHKWNNVAISADGSVISAVQLRDDAGNGNGEIYTSTDGGATWTVASHGARWSNIAMSSDGSTIIAAPAYNSDYEPDYLYLSTSSGASWTPVTTIGSRADAYWDGVAVSDDGQTIVANNAHEGGSYAIGSVYISHDRGATWTKTSAAQGEYTSVAMSGNGQTILAAQWGIQNDSQPGIAVLSTDGGATWSQVPIAPNQNFYGSAVSRDGSTLALTTQTEDGADGTYGSVYLGTLVPPPTKPVIDPIHTGATTITGTTSPNATVTAHFAGGVIASATANSSGRFTILVPNSVTLAENNEITFDAVSQAGATSATTSVTVQVVPSPPNGPEPGNNIGDTDATHPTRTSSSGTLASTGTSLWMITLCGLGLITLGGMTFLWLRSKATVNQR